MTKRISEKDSMLNRLNIQIREIEQKHHQQSMQKQQYIYEVETQLAMASDTIDKHHEKNKEHRHKEKRIIREMNDLKTEMAKLNDANKAIEKEKTRHEQKMIREYIPQRKYELDLSELKSSYEQINETLINNHKLEMAKKMEEIKKLKRDNRLKITEIDNLNQLVENLKREHDVANNAMLHSIKHSHTRIGELEMMLHKENPEKGIKTQASRDWEVRNNQKRF